MKDLADVLKEAPSEEGEGNPYEGGYDDAVQSLFDALEQKDVKAFGEALHQCIELCQHEEGEEGGEEPEEGESSPHKGLLMILGKPHK